MIYLISEPSTFFIIFTEFLSFSRCHPTIQIGILKLTLGYPTNIEPSNDTIALEASGRGEEGEQ